MNQTESTQFNTNLTARIDRDYYVMYIRRIKAEEKTTMEKINILNECELDMILPHDSKENLFFERFIGPACFFSYCNGKAKIEKVNKKYLSEIGVDISEEEHMSITSDVFFDDGNNRLFINAVETVISTSKEQTVVLKKRMFSQCCGENIAYIRCNIQLIGEKKGKYLFYSMIQNITEEKTLIEEISESEEKFRNAAEQANVYAWEYDIRTKDMRPCVRCMRDLGLPAVVKNYPEPAIECGIFPPDYADYYRDMMKQIDNGIPTIEGIIPLTPNRVPFFVRYNTEFDANGKPIKAFGSATLVIDSEKQAEYEEIVKTLSCDYIDVISVDVEKNTCKIIKADGTFFDKQDISNDEDFEYSFSNQVQKFISRQVCPCDIHMMKEALNAETVSGELEKSGDYSRTFRIKVDGNTHYMQFRFFRLSGKNTVVCALMNVDKAVDDQKKQSEILENALDSAKRANAAKSVFLSHMSHDIRTPLNGIIGLLEMEERHPDDAELLTSNRGKMKVAANHLLSLINDVLDLSKMEDENTVLAKDPFDIRNIYSDVLSIAGMRASEDGITLSRVDKARVFDKPFVYGSPLHLRKILLNIINNSIKYNKPNGSVSCEIESRFIDGKICYRFTISDTGIGMSEEFQKKMFEPFSQERADAKSVFQGTGLGMSIVKALIDKMNGSIEVSSIVDVGSTFVITIPFDIAPENEIHSDSGIKVETSLSNVRVLLVEDNELNAEIATMLLEDVGATVSVVTDGQQAVDTVSQNPEGTFDVVLMDVMMPVMDGLEATRQIRKMNRSDAATLPIIAMTANAFADDIQNCKEAGMNAHIAKPLNGAAAMATIAEHIR